VRFRFPLLTLLAIVGGLFAQPANLTSETQSFIESHFRAARTAESAQQYEIHGLKSFFLAVLSVLSFRFPEVIQGGVAPFSYNDGSCFDVYFRCMLQGLPRVKMAAALENR
jgi:hypothetical protein